MGVFIFEDNPIQAERIKQLLNVKFMQNKIEITVMATSRLENILHQLTFTEALNLYVLDLEIKSDVHAGLKAAKKIRELDQQGIIVFLTSHRELAPLSYQYMVSALTFIEKKDWQRISEELDRVVTHFIAQLDYAAYEEMLVVENEHTIFQLPLREVLYIGTVEAHRLELVSVKRYIQFYGSLKEFEEKKGNLVRCHQSYIVNVEHIRCLSQKEKQIELTNGEMLPVSRRFFSKVRQKIGEFKHVYK
ncbi:LytR/AlgR family response regulator transcription factor [Enterococcus sp. DIV0756]|uniref:LytR/AlgR family response regulator transcription factor n=1 Tax=Enterococcus sp. DIV0756 TaxID=2774636 RepID=UPI003F232840